MSKEIHRHITVRNEEGLHARPASQLVQAVRNLKCEIRMSVREGEEIDGKSILGVMMLAAERGTQLLVRVKGEDAEEALKAIARVLEDHLPEGV